MLSSSSSLSSGKAVTLSTEQIKAHGDVKTRLGIIWFVGVICGILAIGGVIAFFVNPTSAKDVWVIIGPIISAGVTGTVSYFAGEQKS
ncbi:hypothetical protein tloyanaT_32090 [Thalassotalea loyana]|uniref:Uncharacterized protein n=1 Tax=Thalassotalea loyana TaxID=280483 RepID=A0ABQ6HIW8_9GAMM|nr:hypothetical protein [Thalassotalea loyana]GLX86956.1 hypothetical protein tloyanaT_32090 [Thalassotalea loyana]